MNCPKCKKKFVPKKHNQAYCSVSCKRAANYDRMKVRMKKARGDFDHVNRWLPRWLRLKRNAALKKRGFL